jgi:hypothetical protein
MPLPYLLSGLQKGCYFLYFMSYGINRLRRDSSASIETVPRMDDRVRFSVGAGIFCSLPRPARLWNPYSLLFSGYQGFFHRDKAAGAWSSTDFYLVRLYLHPPVRLHSMVRNFEHKDNFIFYLLVATVGIRDERYSSEAFPTWNSTEKEHASF